MSHAERRQHLENAALADAMTSATPWPPASATVWTIAFSFAIVSAEKPQRPMLCRFRVLRAGRWR